jgi:Dockerin type I domain
VLGALKDNTLYQSDLGSVSNGKGDYVFAGVTKTALIRRALLAFDVAAHVPRGATITAVELRLNMSMSITGPQVQHLHRVLNNWGEGTSDAIGGEGAGTLATRNDATWLHTFWSSQFWSAPGGDFAATPSASQTVDGIGYYYWSGPDMAADVQQWLDDPATNFGWLIRDTEAGTTTTKRYDSRELEVPALVPQLTVQYDPPTPCPADVDDSGEVNGLDLAQLLGLWTGAATYSSCPPHTAYDLNQDCKVNGLDLAMLLAAWGPC